MRYIIIEAELIFTTKYGKNQQQKRE